jgi:hypothetical protein
MVQINFYIIERHRPIKTSLETFSGAVLNERVIEPIVIDSLDHYQSLYPDSVILDSVMFPEDPVSGFTEEMRIGLFQDSNQCSLQGKRMICIFSWDKVLSLLRVNWKIGFIPSKHLMKLCLSKNCIKNFISNRINFIIG